MRKHLFVSSDNFSETGEAMLSIIVGYEAKSSAQVDLECNIGPLDCAPLYLSTATVLYHLVNPST